MGLDNYFVKPCGPGETAPRVDVKSMLCGGMFSGDPDGSSFRGKVYDDIVQEACDLSLYDDLTPAQVTAIGEGLDELLEADTSRAKFGAYGISRDEVANLALICKAYATEGYGLHAWY